jgi:hypothetical protein
VLEGVKEASMVYSVEGSLNVELQQARDGAVAPGCMCSVDDELDSEVSGSFGAVAHLRFREEALRLRRGGDAPTNRCLEDFANGTKE